MTHTTRHLLRFAFRATYLKTFDSLVRSVSAREIDGHTAGFLDQLPLVAGCALQIQLDQLLQTWKRLSCDDFEVTDVDHCVCYCVANQLAGLAELNDQRMMTGAAAGMDIDVDFDPLWLASRMRALQITWPFSNDSALVVRDRYLSPHELDLPARRTVEQSGSHDALLQLVGRWAVTPDILANATGLLTKDEVAELGAFFTRHPELMNL